MDIPSIRKNILSLGEGRAVNICFINGRQRRNEEFRPGMITGVYPHLFKVQTEVNGQKLTRSVQYSDLLTGRVLIEELA